MFHCASVVKFFEMEANQITGKIIQCAIEVHKNLGPGLLESSYKECLYFELLEAGLKVEKEKALPLVYKDVKLDCGYRIDLLVENKIVVDLKAVEALTDVHMAQILTYLKLQNLRFGLLINFNVALLKDGIKELFKDIK